MKNHLLRDPAGILCGASSQKTTKRRSALNLTGRSDFSVHVVARRQSFSRLGSIQIMSDIYQKNIISVKRIVKKHIDHRGAARLSGPRMDWVIKRMDQRAICGDDSGGNAGGWLRPPGKLLLQQD